MTLTLPDDLQLSDRFTQAELRTELALALFHQDRLTLAQAARLAGLPQLELQRLLHTRGIPLHYDLEELEHDLERAARLSQP